MAEQTEDAGRREIEAKKSLAQYAVKGLTYVRDGKVQEADEVYQCSKESAVRALQDSYVGSALSASPTRAKRSR